MAGNNRAATDVARPGSCFAHLVVAVWGATLAAPRPMHTAASILILIGVLVGTGCSVRPAEHVKRADDFVAQKKFAEAIIEYRSALEQDANLGGARLKLADLYAQQGDVQNAYREYLRAADVLPDNQDAQLKAGAMLLMADRFTDARIRAEGVLRAHPDNAGALMLLGNALAGSHDMEGALRRLNEAIAADPGSGLAYSNLGTLQLAGGDRELAEASFKKAITANPNETSARVALANYYRSQNRDVDAEATLREAARVDPQNVQVNANLVELYIRIGRPGDAEAPLKAIVAVMNNADTQFALAEYYVRMKRPADARPILEKLSQTKEHYALAKASIAAVDYKEGRTTEAHKTVDEVLQRDPNNRTALLLKGQLLSSERKFDEALRFLKSAGAADPGRATEPDLVVAKIYIARGQLEEAQDTYKQLLTHDPRSIPAQLGLAQLYAARGEVGAATELARGAVANAPNNVEARLTLVRTLIAGGNAAEAEKELRVLHDNLPQSAAVQVELGALFLSKNDAAAARTAFSKALSLGAETPEALAGLIGLDLASNNQAAALDRLQARLREAPNDKHAWYLAAHLYFSLKDFRRTEEALKKTIELDPSNLSAYAMLGGVYGAQGRLDDARQEFETWALRQPRSVAAHTMIAMLLENQNKQEEARKAYQKILEIDPNAPIAANNLAFQYAESGGNLDVALQLAQAAKAQLPDEPQFNDTLGWVYYKQDILDQAGQFIQHAIDRDPKNPQFHYHLGMVFAKQGEDDRAIAELKEALKLNARFDEARRALAQLDIP